MAEPCSSATASPSRVPLRVLRPLIAEAPSARPFEFFSGVLGKARLRFVSRLGSEANDAIDALLDRALDYEEAHGTSLAGFVNWFQAGEIEIKRNMEQGAGEVRVMTVHGAKGLEAPIVILPDTTSGPSRAAPTPLLMLEGGDGHAKVPLWPVPKLEAVQGGEGAQGGAEGCGDGGIPPPALCRDDAGLRRTLCLRLSRQARALRELLVQDRLRGPDPEDGRRWTTGRAGASAQHR